MLTMTAEKIEKIKEKMPILIKYFNIINLNNINLDHEKNDAQFQSIINNINEILYNYQRSKTGILIREFEQLSILYSNTYKNATLPENKLLKIRLNVLPIFAMVDQNVDLSNHF